jgi:hypothetical protein
VAIEKSQRISRIAEVAVEAAIRKMRIAHHTANIVAAEQRITIVPLVNDNGAGDLDSAPPAGGAKPGDGAGLVAAGHGFTTSSW